MIFVAFFAWVFLSSFERLLWHSGALDWVEIQKVGATCFRVRKVVWWGSGSGGGSGGWPSKRYFPLLSGAAARSLRRRGIFSVEKVNWICWGERGSRTQAWFNIDLQFSKKGGRKRGCLILCHCFTPTHFDVRKFYKKVRQLTCSKTTWICNVYKSDCHNLQLRTIVRTNWIIEAEGASLRFKEDWC